jgi:hypothetical protein
VTARQARSHKRTPIGLFGADQKWYGRHKAASLELERAAMMGRIEDARAEITSRLQILGHHPELHKAEFQAVQDALRNLVTLEQEEARTADADRKHVLEEAKQKLHGVATRFKK